MNQNRELEELQDRLEQIDRQKSAQQRELEDLYSSKDDVGKNVSTICKDLEHFKYTLDYFNNYWEKFSFYFPCAII